MCLLLCPQVIYARVSQQKIIFYLESTKVNGHTLLWAAFSLGWFRLVFEVGRRLVCSAATQLQPLLACGL